MKILIIDNSSSSSSLLMAILKEFNYMYVAQDEQQADYALKENEIDLILLSYVLPGTSGVDVCKAISGNMMYEDIPIIMVTANNDIKTLQSSFENGATDYISKPFNGQELLARVQAHLIKKSVIDRRKKDSITDALTSLYNRRHFDTIFEYYYTRMVSEKKPLTFMIMDIDNFKKYNDNYGHQLGDETLKSVANVLHRSLNRTNDYLFRIGGEEFGILLYDTPSVFIERLNRSIHAALHELHLEHKYNEAYGYVTISIGCIVCHSDIGRVNIYSKADEALYKSKQTGRARSTFVQV